MNCISKPHLDDFVRRHRSSVSISDILIARRLVSAQDVMTAREIQRKSSPKSKRIGETLVEMGLIEERHVVEALAEKFHLPLLDPDITEIDVDLVRKVSLKYLRRQVALPIKLEAGQLQLLVADPTMTHFVEEIERLFTCRVQSGSRGKQQSSIRNSSWSTRCFRARTPESATIRRSSITLSNRRLQTGDDRVVQMVDQLIRSAIDEGASDVHVEPMANKLRIRYRIDGVLVHKMDLPRDYTPRIISRIKILADADVAERRKHQDGRIFVKTDKQEIDIRASFYATVFGENVVLRILNKASLIGLQELGFAPNILRMYSEDVLAAPSGITLITGPTGSGKTTTLYSSIDHCNDPTVKIITCEDPVEYVIDGISQCSINEKIGLGCHAGMLVTVQRGGCRHPGTTPAYELWEWG